MVMAELEEAAAQQEQQQRQQQQSARPLFNGGLVLIEPILLAPDGDRSMIHPMADRALKRRTSWLVIQSLSQSLSQSQLCRAAAGGINLLLYH